MNTPQIRNLDADSDKLVDLLKRLKPVAEVEDYLIQDQTKLILEIQAMISTIFSKPEEVDRQKLNGLLFRRANIINPM